jgi:hypothetical protein
LKHRSFDANWADLSRKTWPPRRLAFYQTKIFAEERYYADVLNIGRATREELFPNDPPGQKRSDESI